MWDTYKKLIIFSNKFIEFREKIKLGIFSSSEDEEENSSQSDYSQDEG